MLGISEPVARAPAPLTSFVGRAGELTEVRRLVSDNRLVTLTGAGGVGKTRLAARLPDELGDSLWWVDLAPITDPGLVAVRVARSLGLPDQPGRPPLDTVARFIDGRRMLMALDNCEHLLDGCCALASALLDACPGLTIVATSREPLGVAGEVAWLTPSLSLTDEAVELFTDRARLARPDFILTDDNAPVVTEICRRLDGIPLAIELAAARVRVLSLWEILDGLHDRFRLLTGGSRTALPRQQTLQASVDWSHALLSEPERVLFRRLSVFAGPFDMDAAHAVAGDPDLPRFRTLDALSLLVDKSLVVADTDGHRIRYRFLETVRDYASDKLNASDESAMVRGRHRDHYVAVAGAAVSGGLQQWIEVAESEIDNLRAAFAYSLDNSDTEVAARLASSLQPLWARGRITEGLAWFDAIAGEDDAVAPAIRARTLVDRLILNHLAGVVGRMTEAEQALRFARDVDDPALLAWALTACGCTCLFRSELALGYFAEALELARTIGDGWQLAQILSWQALAAFVAGDPALARVAGDEGRGLADAIGEDTVSRVCRWCIGLALWLSGDLPGAEVLLADLATEARATHHLLIEAVGSQSLGMVRAYRGDVNGARAAANSASESAADLAVGFHQGAAFGASAYASLAAGDATAAVADSTTGWQACGQTELLAINCDPMAESALAAGDVTGARRWADDALAGAVGAHRMVLLATRVRVAIAEGDVEQAVRDAHDALTIAADTAAYLTIPDVIECLARLRADSGAVPEAVRLFGGAASLRERTGQVRFGVYDAGWAATIAALRDTLGDSVFEDAWGAGAAASTEEIIGYARRSRGERRRPSSGWASLTPSELDVARLVTDGLANKEIAARLFISPRTVQTHLSHIYAKLGLRSRVQLVQEVSRHS